MSFIDFSFIRRRRVKDEIHYFDGDTGEIYAIYTIKGKLVRRMEARTRFEELVLARIAAKQEFLRWRPPTPVPDYAIRR